MEDTVMRLSQSYPIRLPTDPAALSRWKLEVSLAAVAAVSDNVRQYNSYERRYRLQVPSGWGRRKKHRLRISFKYIAVLLAR